MKQQAWPSTHLGEEKPIPAPSHYPDDILVDLKLHTRGANIFFEKVIANHPNFCVIGKNPQRASAAQLMIVEVEFDHHKTFSFIESITQHAEGPDIFLISEVPDARLAKQAIQIGVKEFFPTPLDSEKIRAALDRYAVEKGKQPKKRRCRVREVISFLGGRGGIGTTTAVVNLGASLQKAKEAPSVVLLELNQQAGDIELFLNTKIPQTLRDLGRTVSKMDKTTLNQFLLKHNSGLNIGSSGCTDFQVKGLGSEWVEPIISTLRAQFDFVLIDCGHTLNQNTLTALGYSSRIIMVSTLSTPVVKSTKLALEFLMRAGVPADKIQCMLNRYIKKENRILNETEEIFGYKTSWIIPNDFPRASQSVNSRCPFTIEAPKSAIAKSFCHMASSLLVNPDAPSSKFSKASQWVNRIWSKVVIDS